MPDDARLPLPSNEDSPGHGAAIDGQVPAAATGGWGDRLRRWLGVAPPPPPAVPAGPRSRPRPPLAAARPRPVVRLDPARGGAE